MPSSEILKLGCKDSRSKDSKGGRSWWPSVVCTSTARGKGSIPDWGAKTPTSCAARPKKKKNSRGICELEEEQNLLFFHTPPAEI